MLSDVEYTFVGGHNVSALSDTTCISNRRGCENIRGAETHTGDVILGGFLRKLYTLVFCRREKIPLKLLKNIMHP